MLDQKGAGPASAVTEGEARKVDNNTGERPSSLPTRNEQVPARVRRRQWQNAAIETLLTLRQRFPLAFARLSARTRWPLKVGIHKDIAAALPELGAEDIGRAMRFYVTGIEYLRVCTEGAARIDLDGEPAGNVSASEARGAQSLLAIAEAWRKQRTPPPQAAPSPAPAPPPRLTLAGLREAAAKRKLAAGGGTP